MTWGFVAIGGATLGAALISSDASSSAAKGQQAATQGGINEQGRQFNTTRADTAPYRTAGTSSLQQLQGMLGMKTQFDPAKAAADAYLKANPDVAADPHYGADPYQHFLDHGRGEGRAWPTVAAPAADASPPPAGLGELTKKFSISDFWNDPVVQASYQSGLDLGTKALKNAAPLTTGLDSGAAMKELTKFGTDYTGNMAAGSQARFVNDQGNQFNKLAAMAGIGQTGVAQSAGVGVNAANNTSNLLTSNANAQGAAKIAGANAFGGGINSVANYWQQQQMLSNLKGGNTGTTGYTPPPNADWYAG